MTISGSKAMRVLLLVIDALLAVAAFFLFSLLAELDRPFERLVDQGLPLAIPLWIGFGICRHAQLIGVAIVAVFNGLVLGIILHPAFTAKQAREWALFVIMCEFVFIACLLATAMIGAQVAHETALALIEATPP